MGSMIERKEGTAIAAQEFESFLTDYLVEYAALHKDMPIERWMDEQLCKYLPDVNQEKRIEIRDNLIKSVDDISKTLDAVEKAADDGLSAEEWLCREFWRHEDKGDLPSAAAILSFQHDLASAARDMMAQIGDENVLRPLSSKTMKAEMTSMADSGFRKSAISTYQKQMGIKLDEAAMGTMLERGDIYMNVAQNAALMGVGGMALTIGMFLMVRKRQRWAEVKQEAVGFGSTLSLRHVISTGLLAATQKGLLPFLKKGTPFIAFATISVTLVESGKMLSQWTKGEIGAWEVVDKAGRISVASCCALFFAGQGLAMAEANVASLTLAVNPIVAGIGVKAIAGFAGLMAGNMIGDKTGAVSYDFAKNLMMIMKEAARGNYHRIKLAENREIILLMKESMKLRTEQAMNRLGY